MKIKSKAAEPQFHSFTREKGGDRVFSITMVVLAILIICIVSYPLLYVIIASFSNPLSISRGDVIFIPKGITLNAYESIITNVELLTGYKNTIIITVGGTLINLIMTTCCAYPLSRRNFAGKNVFTIFITFTMFFNAGMIPNYLLMKQLDLLNSTWSLMLPGAISVYNMLIMRNFFQSSIPEEVMESATIDGCNNIQTLLRIVLPLSKGIMAVMVIFYAVGHWNSYFDAMLYISDKTKYPLQLVLRNILLESQNYFLEGTGAGYSTAESALSYVSIQYAIIVVSSLPVLILYPLMQKHFVKGVMIGAVKG